MRSIVFFCFRQDGFAFSRPGCQSKACIGEPCCRPSAIGVISAFAKATCFPHHKRRISPPSRRLPFPALCFKKMQARFFLPVKLQLFRSKTFPSPPAYPMKNVCTGRYWQQESRNARLSFSLSVFFLKKMPANMENDAFSVAAAIKSFFVLQS